jgi:Protein of unknown function (DUF3592)
MPSWFRYTFMIIGLGLIVGFIALVYYEHQRANAAAHWPVVSGAVVATDLERVVSTDKDSRGNRRTSVSWDPKVFYRYTVTGRQFRSESLWLNSHSSFGSEAEGEAFLKPYRIGAPLKVRYNPQDPADAAVIVEPPAYWLLAFCLMGAAFFAAGWYCPKQ